MHASLCMGSPFTSGHMGLKLNMGRRLSLMETSKTPSNSGNEKYWQSKCLLPVIPKTTHLLKITVQLSTLRLLVWFLEGSRSSPHYRNGGLLLSAFPIRWIARDRTATGSPGIFKYLPAEDPSDIPGMQISERFYENVEINIFSPCQDHCQTFMPVLHWASIDWDPHLCALLHARCWAHRSEEGTEWAGSLWQGELLKDL